MAEKFYLAYGSNLNQPQMRARCPGAEPAGTAELAGWRLAFRGRDSGFYLTIEPAAGHAVPVAVWSVGAPDERALDLYEDYPVFYYKRNMTVCCRDQKAGAESRLEAFVYIMREGFPTGLPTREYMDACLEGYRSFGFDPQPLLEAREYGLK